MIKMVVGHSDNVDPDKALHEVIGQCEKALAGAAPKAGIFYTSIMELDYGRILARLNLAFPGMELVGCTTDGEMSNAYHFAEDSMALAVFASDSLEFAAGMAEGVSKDPEGAVRRAYERARAKTSLEPALCIALPDGLTTMSLSLDRALAGGIVSGVPVLGGNAGDHFRLERTWQFMGDRVVSDGVAVLLVCGSPVFSFALAGGWKPLGLEFPIGEYDKNVIKTIGGRPALEFYRHYLGEHEGEFSQFPLAVYEEGGGGEYYLRAPAFLNEEEGSVVFNGAFAENCVVRLTEAGREDILAAAGEAVDRAAASFSGTRVEAALIFTCTSRRHVLGSKAGGESAFLAERLPGTPFLGFATYGELAPLGPDDRVRFHNDTIVVLLLGE